MPPMKLKILYLLLSLSNLYDIFTRPVTRSSLSRLFELTTKRFYCLLINSHSYLVTPLACFSKLDRHCRPRTWRTWSQRIFRQKKTNSDFSLPATMYEYLNKQFWNKIGVTTTNESIFSKRSWLRYKTTVFLSHCWGILDFKGWSVFYMK